MSNQFHLIHSCWQTVEIRPHTYYYTPLFFVLRVHSPNILITRMVRVSLPPANSAHIYIYVNCILIKKKKRGSKLYDQHACCPLTRYYGLNLGVGNYSSVCYGINSPPTPRPLSTTTLNVTYMAICDDH